VRTPPNGQRVTNKFEAPSSSELKRVMGARGHRLRMVLGLPALFEVLGVWLFRPALGASASAARVLHRGRHLAATSGRKPVAANVVDARLEQVVYTVEKQSGAWTEVASEEVERAGP
jgi:hypothetical protein